MAYRSDVDALAARVQALSAELADRERERDEVARMLAEARAKEQADRVAADYAAGGPQRRLRRRLTIAVSAAATLVAALVAWRVTHRHDDRMERALQRFDRYATEMCECADSGCVQHVSEDMAKWAMQMQKDDFPPPGKIDAATMKRAQAIAERMTKCMEKASGQAPISTNGAQ